MTPTQLYTSTAHDSIYTYIDRQFTVKKDTYTPQARKNNIYERLERTRSTYSPKGDIGELDTILYT